MRSASLSPVVDEKVDDGAERFDDFDADFGREEFETDLFVGFEDEEPGIAAQLDLIELERDEGDPRFDEGAATLIEDADA